MWNRARVFVFSYMSVRRASGLNCTSNKDDGHANVCGPEARGNGAGKIVYGLNM